MQKAVLLNRQQLQEIQNQIDEINNKYEKELKQYQAKFRKDYGIELSNLKNDRGVYILYQDIKTERPRKSLLGNQQIDCYMDGMLHVKTIKLNQYSAINQVYKNMLGHLLKSYQIKVENQPFPSLKKVLYKICEVEGKTAIQDNDYTSNERLVQQCQKRLQNIKNYISNMKDLMFQNYSQISYFAPQLFDTDVKEQQFKIQHLSERILKLNHSFQQTEKEVKQLRKLVEVNNNKHQQLQNQNLKNKQQRFQKEKAEFKQKIKQLQSQKSQLKHKVVDLEDKLKEWSDSKSINIKTEQEKNWNNPKTKVEPTTATQKKQFKQKIKK